MVIIILVLLILDLRTFEVKLLSDSFGVLLCHLGVLWLNQLLNDVQIIFELQAFDLVIISYPTWHDFLVLRWNSINATVAFAVKLMYWPKMLVVVGCAALQSLRESGVLSAFIVPHSKVMVI